MFGCCLYLLLSIYITFCFCDKQCTQPSRFHCKNLNTAKNCSYQDRCVNIWKNSKWTSYDNDPSAKCVYCLHYQNPMNDIKDALKLCTIENTEETCVRFLNSWKEDNENLNNSVAFCNVISMCKSHTYLGDLNFGSVCEDCKKIIDDIRVLLEDDETSNAIINKFNGFCDSAPAMIRDYCKETVKAHVPAILRMLEVQLNPHDVCALVGLCSLRKPTNITIGAFLPLDEAKPDPVVTHVECNNDPIIPWYYEKRAGCRSTPTQSSSIEKPSCDECKAVLDQIRHVLNDPAMRDQLKKEIDEKICSTLPSFLITACKTAINVHFDEILDSLEKADLTQVCATFKMCPGGYQPSIGLLPQTSLRPGIPLPGTCQVCELVFHKLIDLLFKDATEKSIADALENVCKLIPPFFRSHCDSFVEQYGAKIIEAVIEGTAPKIFCTAIGFCGPLPILSVVPESPQRPLKIEPCSTCKLIVTVIQQQLTLNRSREAIESAVNELCDILPGSYGNECKSLVHEYLPSVIDYISKSMTPLEICQEIGLCHSNAQLANLEQDITPLCNSDDLDVLCTNLDVARRCDMGDTCLIYRQARYLYDSLQTPEVQSSGCFVCAERVSLWKLFKRRYGHILENGFSCIHYTDADDRALCQEVVDNRFKIQHRLMDSKLKPVDLCKELHMCSSVLKPHSKPVGINRSTATLILLCSANDKTLCASKRLAALCGKNHLCQAFNPMNQAQPIKPVDIFGGNACEWGPSHYCQDEETAKLCGPEALQHCRQNVWTTDAPIKKQHVEALGKNPCTRGPAFWCFPEENAHACGPHAVETCRRLRKLARV